MFSLFIALCNTQSGPLVDIGGLSEISHSGPLLRFINICCTGILFMHGLPMSVKGSQQSLDKGAALE